MAKKNKQKAQNQTVEQTKPTIAKSPEMAALEQRRNEMNDQILHIQNQKAKLEKEKRELEAKRQQAEKEKSQAEKDVERLKREVFEIREAVRRIEQLTLSQHTESANPKILALMNAKMDGKNRNGQNDQSILAVAARYKLNDVVLYTEDKNLKNHAVAIGIQTE
ncbi:hypothetical protein HYE54_06580 [Aggregatibacter actinomycetemcomitans]|uniref:PIN domain-containing protein n=1 Tax=Aggregatibacter actinomycetemcomitans TaxID=714 RepID=UPI00197B206D|nr:PIN domain-containing protein [Aggregatibacter actinomycetemcomitans]MBN6068426.1 hypothetical protein [Aggregatibacter actinomycetemcomitans]MBN6085056.1 hypothetical protein [Aggregatibacter actinomycetemcomitans]